MRSLLLILAIVLGASAHLPAAGKKDDPTANAVWITGQVLVEDGTLLFRADRPVKGNPRGNVIMLGATRNTMKVLLPVYASAAEKHLSLRLFGVLQAFSATVASHPKPLPNVEFITWKVHLPSDPDELPPGQRITIHPGDTVEGSKVEVAPRRR